MEHSIPQLDLPQNRVADPEPDGRRRRPATARPTVHMVRDGAAHGRVARRGARRARRDERAVDARVLRCGSAEQEEARG